MSNIMQGSWLYRSFHNVQDELANDPDALSKLLFGEGILILHCHSPEDLKGTLSFGTEYTLDVNVAARSAPFGGTPSFTAIATGRPATPTSGWVYEYYGHVAFAWPHAKQQLPTLIGTVIRSVAHGTGQAGYTASFAAVRRHQ